MTMRAIVKFDTTAIPAGSTVTGARLQLYVTSATLLNLASGLLNVHPVTQDWDEDFATRSKRTAASNWTTVYGSCDSNNILASVQYSSLTNGTWVTFDLPASLVQTWINTPSTNYGVLLKRADETDPHPVVSTTKKMQNLARFASSESPTNSIKPKLTVDFTASGNIKPFVGITLPTNRVFILPHEPQKIESSAYDPDGAVKKVMFYANGNLIGQDVTSPYAIEWQAMLAGTNYVLTAVAYDSSDACSTSAPVNVRALTAIYSADMNANPGWTLGAGWQYGKPGGKAGYHDEGDPSSGYTSNNVVGFGFTVWAGQASESNTAVYATTPSIDCSNYTNTVLSFHYWLGMGGSYWDIANVQISTNNTTWTTLWTNPGEAMTLDCWRQMTIDIKAHADRKPTVYIRWGVGPVPTYYYSGWNIDDVVIAGMPPAPVIADADADTITDTWETHYFTNTLNCVTNADVDRDGLSNQEEFIAGTDPTVSNESPFELIASMSGTNLVLSFPTIEASKVYYSQNRYYSLIATTNLISPVWTNVAPVASVVGSNQILSCTNTLPYKQQYYRFKTWLQ